MYQTGDQIRFWAEIKPDELAFVDESHEVTFRELDMYTRRIAYFLEARGLVSGELVAISLPPYLSWFFTLSLYRLGNATLYLSENDGNAELTHPDWLVSLAPIKHIDASKTLVVTELLLETINASPGIISDPGFTSKDDLAWIFGTSGTTGTVKHIAVSAVALEEMAIAPRPYYFLGDEPVMSLFQFGSWWATAHALKLLVSGKCFFSCTFPDFNLPKIISKHSVKTIFGSPQQVSSLLEIQRQTGTEFPALKTVIIGGGYISDKLLSQIRKQINCRIFNIYGSSECGNIGNEELMTSESKGFVINRGVEVQIVDEHNSILENGEEGIIRTRSKAMFHQYHQNPNATKKSFKDGFFYPGDLGLINEAGKLVLKGRVDEVMNLGGYKIDPNVIDSLISSQLGVLDCASFTVTDAFGIDQVFVAIVANTEFQREQFEKTVVKKSLVPIKGVFQVNSIPRNANGKILRGKLKEIYDAQI